MAPALEARVIRESDERIRAWQRTGNTADLWPEISEPVRMRALAEIERVARAVLVGAAAFRRLEASTLRDARALGIAAFTSGMGPLLGFWLETRAIEADPALAALLGRHLHHGRVRAKRLEEELARVLDALSGRGVIPTVLKGFHTAREFFPEPGTRPSADIDLLVHPAQLGQAAAGLRAAGLIESTRNAGASYKGVWVPAGVRQTVQSLELTHALNPWSIELHTSLDRTFWGSGPVGFGAGHTYVTETWCALTRPARVLAEPLLAAFLALHISQELHTLPLVRLVELVLVVRDDRTRGRLDWAALRSLLSRSGAARYVFPAFALVERLAPGTVDPAFYEKIAAAAPSRVRRVLHTLAPADAQRFDQAALDEKLMWIDGPAGVARWASHLIQPLSSDGSLADTFRTYGRWLNRLRRGRISLRRSDDCS